MSLSTSTKSMTGLRRRTTGRLLGGVLVAALLSLVATPGGAQIAAMETADLAALTTGTEMPTNRARGPRLLARGMT